MTHDDIKKEDTSLWPRLDLGLGPEALASLARQIQYGGSLPVDGDELRTVREFMVHALGLEPDYVEQRVTTVFLDGRAVDDLDAAHVRSGSCLSLSAAMPGVAGIVMRRKSPFSRMRALELVGNPDVECDGTAGSVAIKLFNFIAVEGGPVLLARGLGLATKRLTGLLADKAFASGVARAALDGRELAAAGLAAALPADPEAMVLVTVSEA